MPRAALNTKEIPAVNPEQNRTGPQPRGTSAFMPAQRTSNSPRGNTLPPRIFGDDQQQEEEEVQIPQNRRPQVSESPTSYRGGGGEAETLSPTTRSGYPDRRFKGQRDLPPPQEAEQRDQRARTGGTVGDVHVTINGKPDKRFKENRGLSEEEVMAQWVDALAEKFGRNRRK